MNWRYKDMNEWQTLDITNLPSDILDGDYEFREEGKERTCVIISLGQLLDYSVRRYQRGYIFYPYQYRKKEPKAPTHEEIMTKWWRNKCGSWFRVNKYYPNYGKNGTYGVGNRNEQRKWFIGKQSATIPPEGE